MNKIPVVFCFDSRILLGAAVAIKSLIEHANAETIYDIRVFHSDLKNKDKKGFLKLIQNTNHEIKFHQIDLKRFLGFPKNRGSWTEVVYFRFIVPEILAEYDKAIYSDVDVFFESDLTELYQTDVSGFEWAGVRAEKNSPNMVGHKYFPENKNDYIYWSGLMLINCKMFRENKIIDKLFKNCIDFAGRLRFFDLDALNITCNNILELPLKYCVLETVYSFDDVKKAKDYVFLKSVYSEQEMVDAKNNTAIIHYAGSLGKPWHRKKMPEYYQNCVNSLPKELVKYTFRDLRKKLFSKI